MREMNFTQAIKALSLALLAAAALSSCEMLKKEETPAFPVEVNVGLPVPVGWVGRIQNPDDKHDYYILNPVEGATVYYYRSESDYLARENPFRVGTTNEKGRDEFTTDSEEDIWIYIEKGELNSMRFAHPDTKSTSSYHPDYMPIYQGPFSKQFSSFSLLAPEIARLQINVMHNGLPVDRARVQLYFSEEAFKADIPAQQELEKAYPTFGYPNEDAFEQYSPEEYEYALSYEYSKDTDASGVAYFNLLEPRRYWFRVTKDGLTNETGTITIEEPLSSTSEATRSITVGIN